MQTTLLIDGQHVQGKDHALPVADPASGCDVPEFVLDFYTAVSHILVALA